MRQRGVSSIKSRWPCQETVGIVFGAGFAGGVERGLDTGGCAHLLAPLRVARVSSCPRLSCLRARLVLQGGLDVGYDELRQAEG